MFERSIVNANTYSEFQVT